MPSSGSSSRHGGSSRRARSSRGRSRRRRRLRLRVGGRELRLRRPKRAEVVGGVLVVVVLLGLWITVSVTETKNDLEDAASSGQVLQDALVSGDKKQAVAALADIRSSTSSAHGHTSGVLWRTLGHVPWLGKNFRAAATISDVADDISDRALPPVVDVATQIDLQNFAPKGGTIDLTKLALLTKPVDTTRQVLASSDARLDRIDAGSLLPVLRDPVQQLQDKVGTGASASSSIQSALKLLPTMIGGPKRTYLLVFQNNAEVRSTGGIPGSAVLVTAEHGTITLGRQGSGGGFGRLPQPALPLTKEEVALYGDNLAQYFVDANLTPDFPRTGEIAQAILKERADIHVDGVLSFDPVAASYVLKGTGPVTLANGTQLTSRNAVDVLLNQVYLQIADPTKQDDFFEAAARTLFTAFTSGRGNPRTTIKGLVKAGAEHRLYVWSSHADEEKTIAATPLGGAITPASGTKPNLGVYLNDSTGAKMEYYLTSHVTVRPTSCTAQDSQYVQVFVSLHSRAPKDASHLPKAVLGDGYGTKPGRMRFNVRFYLPVGSVIRTATAGTTTLPLQTQPYEKHAVYTLPVELQPGQSTRLQVDFQTADGQPGDVTVVRTPGAQAGKGLTVEPTQCGF